MPTRVSPKYAPKQTPEIDHDTGPDIDVVTRGARLAAHRMMSFVRTFGYPWLPLAIPGYPRRTSSKGFDAPLHAASRHGRSASGPRNETADSRRLHHRTGGVPPIAECGDPSFDVVGIRPEFNQQSGRVDARLTNRRATNFHCVLRSRLDVFEEDPMNCHKKSPESFTARVYNFADFLQVIDHRWRFSPNV